MLEENQWSLEQSNALMTTLVFTLPLPLPTLLPSSSTVALPDPTTAEPFYKTIWFIAVVALAGLILVVLPFIFITVLCSKYCLRFKKGTDTSGCGR